MRHRPAGLALRQSCSYNNGVSTASVSARSCAEEVARGCLASRVRMLGRVISGLYQEQLDAHGLTVAQFNILTALVLSRGMSPGALSARLRLEKSTISRNLRLMVDNGWARVVGRGRSQQVTPTAEGERLYGAAYPAWVKAQGRTKALLGNAGIKALGVLTDSLALA
jgi:DNA-binding MarR family transcriptional regulator